MLTCGPTTVPLFTMWTAGPTATATAALVGSAGKVSSMRDWFAPMLAVARRPRLWSVAIRQARLLAPPRWWAQRPHLPVPDARYMQFRALTQYGDGSHRLEPADVVSYLTWCRELHEVRS